MQTSPRRATLRLFLIVFWALFVLGGYYYYHKPISMEMLAAPLSALLDVAFAVGFAGLSGAIGRKLWRAEGLPALEQSALQFALGTAAISLLWLLIGTLGGYHLPLAAPLLVLGLIVLRRDALIWFSSFRELLNSWRTARALEKGLALLCAVMLVYQLLIALAPPTKWDALTYHLQLPRQYLAAGRLIFVPENPYWGHPQIVEMLYTLALSFHRFETAALLGWTAGVVFLSGLFGLTRSQLSRTAGPVESTPASSTTDSVSTPDAAPAGWMAVTAVLAGFTFRHMLSWSYTDLFSALYGLAALIALFTWLDTRKDAWFLLTGLSCGLAAGTKWTAGALALGIFLAVLLLWKRTPFAKALDARALDARAPDARPHGWLIYLLGGLVALAAVLPWLVRNMIATGSPLYPYLIGTPWFNAARLASADVLPASIIWWQHLLLPLSSTWAGVDSAPGFGADLGPLLLLFGLPGFWVYRRSLKTQAAALILLPAALAIAFASLRLEHLMQTRLYFALLPILAMFCGWGWEWLQRQVWQGVRLRRILAAVVLLTMGLALWQDTRELADLSPGRLVMGAISPSVYQENTLGYYTLAMHAVEQLPASARTLFLWEPRGLYAPLNVQADLWIDRWRTDRRELGSAEPILAQWRGQGFTHLLVYQRGLDLIQPQPGQSPTADWTVWQALEALLPTPQTIGDDYLIYSLK